MNIKSKRKFLTDSISNKEKLLPMPQLNVLCGKNGGLPFEYLMTDVISGCLPIEKICYGNCSAAEYWIEKGYNFGKRILNSFTEESFNESILKLEKNQRWLRQGWASDCSFSKEAWEIVARSSEILAKHNIHLVIITKAFTHPDDSIIRRLVESGVEFRVSISAIDETVTLSKRKEILKKYKDLGGKAVPYLMSAQYSNQKIASIQNDILSWIQELDFIAAEHPLRISKDNSLMEILSTDGLYHPKFPDQYWFGRILYNVPNFLLPPPTCLLPEYQLNFRSYSEVGKNSIDFLDTNMPRDIDLKKNIDSFSTNINKHATYDIKKV